MSTKDYFDKDYYKVLGLSKDAKPADIKKAFRKIARDNHPDAHPGDKKAEQRFKEASEANDILSDPDKRREYDEARRLLGAGYRPSGPGGAGGFPGGGGFSSAGFGNLGDLFNQAGGSGNISDLLGGLLGNAARGRASARPSAPRARRGADVEGTVTLDFRRAVDGATVTVSMVGDQPCPACRGTGAKDASLPRVCPTCQGTGVNQRGGLMGVTEPCPECHGRGLLVDDPCPVCHGSGKSGGGKTMQVRIPAGVDDGQRIRIKGKGAPGENGGPAGDLYVTVNVTPHPVFGRKGNNLTIEVPVTYVEAALGTDIEVPTLGGTTVRLRVPAGTPSGRTFRVRGKGVAGPKGEPGDLLATIEVTVPPTLTQQAKDALLAYEAVAHELAPRADLLARASS
ncbi:MAG: molecular chaperone DnaJ [Propionibacteriaceae bacterium]|nr:molecular chaperone DnaJ [Propionibacteriaceae bacterium]